MVEHQRDLARSLDIQSTWNWLFSSGSEIKQKATANWGAKPVTCGSLREYLDGAGWVRDVGAALTNNLHGRDICIPFIRLHTVRLPRLNHLLLDRESRIDGQRDTGDVSAGPAAEIDHRLGHVGRLDVGYRQEVPAHFAEFGMLGSVSADVVIEDH